MRALLTSPLVLSTAIAWAASASAQQPPPSSTSGATRKTPAAETNFGHSALFDRPHTVAELELGALALPDQPISPANRGGQLPFGQSLFRGDATLDIGLHLLYRARRDVSVGALASFAPSPTSDNQYLSGNGTIPRTHSRSYMFLGGEARYHPLRYRWLEGWVGITAGEIIIGDRFATEGESVPAILGSRQYTVSTEGFAFGVEAGGNYLFTDNIVFGITARASRWILPHEDPQCSPIGDCPTLTGSVFAAELGLTIGYRIPL